MSRLYAYCRVHADQKSQCKIDRVFARVWIGLVGLWIKRSNTCDNMCHQLLKVQFAAAESYESRAAERGVLKKHAEDDSELAFRLRPNRKLVMVRAIGPTIFCVG